MAAPAGYTKLPAGIRCRCLNLWKEGDEFWCCSRVPIMLSDNAMAKWLDEFSRSVSVLDDAGVVASRLREAARRLASTELARAHIARGKAFEEAVRLKGLALEALKDVAEGNMPGALLNPLLDAFNATGDKLAFREAFSGWLQERARDGLAAARQTTVAAPTPKPLERDTMTDLSPSELCAILRDQAWTDKYTEGQQLWIKRQAADTIERLSGPKVPDNEEAYQDASAGVGG